MRVVGKGGFPGVCDFLGAGSENNKKMDDNFHSRSEFPLNTILQCIYKIYQYFILHAS